MQTAPGPGITAARESQGIRGQTRRRAGGADGFPRHKAQKIAVLAARVAAGLCAAIMLLGGLPAGALLAAQQPERSGSARQARLAAVVEFADNVLEKGRDHYGPRHTPLFADGLNVDSLEAVRWRYQGHEWIPSNLASQQNLFRTLVGLSNLTGQARYRRAAKEAIAYHFEHLPSPCGLLYWGGHCWIDLRTEQPVGEQKTHELKFNLPFYELMWEVDPAATRQFLRAFWNAHVLDWSTLDFNRHGTYGRAMGKLWEHSFSDPAPFFEGDGLTFINTGTDLIYAGVMLHRLDGEPGALLWSKRLAHQYVKARHPDTGLGAYQFSKPRRRRQLPNNGPLPTSSSYGDRAENQFGPEFGPVAREGWMLRAADSIYGVHAVVELQLAEMLGPEGEGKPFVEWTCEGLRACAKWLYDPRTNRIRPAWADGTDLSGYVIKRDGYYGKAGTVFRPREASSMLLWAYVLGHRLTGDPLLWQTARSMAQGQGLGDWGERPGVKVNVNLQTGNADPVALFAVLELCHSNGSDAYRRLAERLGDNIVRRRFHHGFFLPSAEHLNARFDALEPLALLSLEALLRGKPEAVPRYRAGRGYIHGPHDGLGRTTDATAIWSARR